MSLEETNSSNVSNQIILSPNGTEETDELAANKEISKLLIDDTVINMLHARVLRDVSTSFNRKIEDFFRTTEFDDKLDDIVERKLNDMVMNTNEQI